MKRIIISLINILSFGFLIYASLSVDGAKAFELGSEMPLIMPAPYAFSIWFVIYLLLAVWLISQFYVSQEAWDAYEKVSRFFAINMLFTGGSLLIGPKLAPLMIFGSLVTLIFIYVSITHALTTFKIQKNEKVLKELKYFKLPFSIFIGWISVALMVDIAVVLKANGYSELFGLPEIFWANLMLIVGGFITIIFRNIHDDLIYPLVFIWAYIAIAIQSMSVFPVLITACGVIVFIAFFLEKQPKVYR